MGCMATLRRPLTNVAIYVVFKTQDDTTTDDEQEWLEMVCVATLCRPLTDVAFSIDARYVGRQATDDVDLLAGHMVFMLA